MLQCIGDHKLIKIESILGLKLVLIMKLELYDYEEFVAHFVFEFNLSASCRRLAEIKMIYN